MYPNGPVKLVLKYESRYMKKLFQTLTSLRWKNLMGRLILAYGEFKSLIVNLGYRRILKIWTILAPKEKNCHDGGAGSANISNSTKGDADTDANNMSLFSI